MIETQYGILSQMIMDIAYRYQTQLKQTEKITDIIRLSLREYIYMLYYAIKSINYILNLDMIITSMFLAH